MNRCKSTLLKKGGGPSWTRPTGAQLLRRSVRLHGAKLFELALAAEDPPNPGSQLGEDGCALRLDEVDQGRLHLGGVLLGVEALGVSHDPLEERPEVLVEHELGGVDHHQVLREGEDVETHLDLHRLSVKLFEPRGCGVELLLLLTAKADDVLELPIVLDANPTEPLHPDGVVEGLIAEDLLLGGREGFHGRLVSAILSAHVHAVECGNALLNATTQVQDSVPGSGVLTLAGADLAHLRVGADQELVEDSVLVREQSDALVVLLDAPVRLLDRLHLGLGLGQVADAGVAALLEGRIVFEVGAQELQVLVHVSVVESSRGADRGLHVVLAEEVREHVQRLVREERIEEAVDDALAVLPVFPNPAGEPDGHLAGVLIQEVAILRRNVTAEDARLEGSHAGIPVVVVHLLDARVVRGVLPVALAIGVASTQRDLEQAENLGTGVGVQDVGDAEARVVLHTELSEPLLVGAFAKPQVVEVDGEQLSVGVHELSAPLEGTVDPLVSGGDHRSGVLDSPLLQACSPEAVLDVVHGEVSTGQQAAGDVSERRRLVQQLLRDLSTSVRLVAAALAATLDDAHAPGLDGAGATNHERVGVLLQQDRVDAAHPPVVRAHALGHQNELLLRQLLGSHRAGVHHQVGTRGLGRGVARGRRSVQLSESLLVDVRATSVDEGHDLHVLAEGGLARLLSVRLCAHLSSSAFYALKCVAFSGVELHTDQILINI